MKKESNLRSKAEISQLVEYFKDIKFFKKYKLSAKDFAWICQGLEYQVNFQRTYICREGQEADKFFIILKG